MWTLRADDRVLDLGCGVGSSASFLAAAMSLDVVGLDASAGFIDEARSRDEKVGWVVGEASALPFADDSFDAVFCECFLSLLDDPAEVLGEIRRILRPGGRLAVSDMYLQNPDAPRLKERLPSGTCLHGALPLKATLERIENAGFRLQMCEDRSDALKTLMASLIFAYGSAACFWEAALGGEQAPTAAAWLSSARPGYLVLVACSP